MEQLLTGLRGKYCLPVGGRGFQGHKTNPDTFVMNYVTTIRGTFTAGVNMNFCLISEIEIKQRQFIRNGAGGYTFLTL